MDDILSNIENYNKKKKVFDEMISHIISDKKARFLTQSYFSVPKDVRLNCTHYISFKLNNRRELQNIVIDNSADIDYKDFIKIYRDCTKKPFNFLTIDTIKDNKVIKNFDEIL